MAITKQEAWIARGKHAPVEVPTTCEIVEEVAFRRGRIPKSTSDRASVAAADLTHQNAERRAAR
jgi:hypothetical protein